MSKTIEIPLDVARAWMAREDDSVDNLQLAIEKALPPSREERLGLPWEYKVDSSLLYGPTLHGAFTNDGTELHTGTAQTAKLIAAAPKLADMLEHFMGYVRLLEHTGSDLDEALALLRECGWLDE